MAINDFFVWGKGGEKLTPEQVKRQQMQAQALQQAGADFSPAGHWSVALGRGLSGFMGGFQDRRARDAESAGIASANEAFSNAGIADMLMGGGSAAPQTVGAAPVAPVTVGEALPAATGADTGSWLQYANQGATRNLPLSDNLVSSLGFLPELGVTMRVVSGGQVGKGEKGGRVGSTRHDHGNAADVDFYIGDRKLTPKSAEDRQILSQIVQRGKAAGITGWGEGDDYMGSGRMHLGFGSPGVWGAGGKSANAPEWLTAAYNSEYRPQTSGAGVQVASADPNFMPDISSREIPLTALQPSPVAEALATQGAKPQMQNSPVANALAPGQIVKGEDGKDYQNVEQLDGSYALSRVNLADGGFPQSQQRTAPNMAAILQLANNPYLNDTQRTILGSVLQQQMQANDPLRALQLQQAQQGLRRGELEIAAMQQPKAPEYGFQTLGDGTVVRTNKATGEVIPAYEGTPKPTTDVQNYEYARSNGYQGSFADYQQDVKRAGAQTTNIDLGNIPAGYEAVRDEAGRVSQIRPLPGSPDYVKAQAAEDAKGAQSDIKSQTANVVTEDIDRALNIIEKSSFPTTGAIGSMISSIGGTASNDLKNLITTVQANAGFDKLQAMRDASPTGGALGAISERELAYLQSTIGSLDQSQTKEQLVYNLKRVRDAYSQIIHGEKPKDDNGGWQEINGVKIRVKQ